MSLDHVVTSADRASVRRTWLRRVQYGTGIAGAILVSFWLAVWVHGKVSSAREIERFAEARERMIEVARLQVEAVHGPESPVDVSLWAEERIAAFQESLFEDLGATLAVLRIPRLDIMVPVLEGTSDSVLNRGAGWIEGTAMPGSDGNCGIASHRDGFFRGLKDIRVGDEIELELLTGSLRYTVDDLTITDPSDVSVLDARDESSVTLVTCYPFYFAGSAPQRFIVHASLSSGSGPTAGGDG